MIIARAAGRPLPNDADLVLGAIDALAPGLAEIADGAGLSEVDATDGADDAPWTGTNDCVPPHAHAITPTRAIAYTLRLLMRVFLTADLSKGAIPSGHGTTRGL